MSGLVQELAERLRSGGIDPEHFLEYGAPAAKEASGGDGIRERQVLERLVAFAEDVRATGLPPWNPWCFGIRELGKAFCGQPDDFLALVDDLTGFVRGVRAGGLGDLCIQRLPPAIHAAARRPWIARTSLAIARELAEGGADPGDALRIALPAIARAVTGVPEPSPYGPPPGPGPEPDRASEEPRFAPVAAALREAFAELDAHAIPPTWPIAQGVAALARSFAGDPEAMAERLRELTELCLALHDVGILPHPSIEHGLVAAFDSIADPWLKGEIFPLALAIASAGKEPGTALARLSVLAGIDPERGPGVAMRLRARAELGLDVASLLASMHPLRHVAPPEEDRFERLLASMESLLEAVQAAGMRPRQCFEDGLPQVLATPPGGTHAERALAIARRLVRASIDPGPVLQHGLAPALEEITAITENVEGLPALAEAVFSGAEALLEAGVNPWRWLSPGVIAAARVADGDPGVTLELLGELRALALDLKAAGVDPVPLFHHGMHNLSIHLRRDRPVFSATLASIRDFAPALQRHGIDPDPAAGRGLAVAAELAQKSSAGWLVPAAAFLGRRLAEAGIDPAETLVTALPPLVQAAGAKREVLEPVFDELIATSITLAGRRDLSAALPLPEVLAAVGRQKDAGIVSFRDAMRLVRDCAARGQDASDLAAAVVPVLPADEQREALLAVLEALAGRAPAGEAFAGAAAAAARVAGGDATALARRLDTLLMAWKNAGASGEAPDPGGVFGHAIRAAAEVAGARGDVFDRLVGALAEDVSRARGDGVDPAPAFRLGAWRAARAAGEREELFLGALDRFVRIAARRGGEDDAVGEALAEHIAPLAIAGADGDARELLEGLDDVARLRDSVGGNEAEWLLPWIARFGELVHRVPAVWRNVLSPVLRWQGGRAATVLDAILHMERRIEDEEAVALLKHVVTQEGVRAPEILWNLLTQGLAGGTIASLSEERELLIGYLRDVPVVDTAFYDAYRKIVRDDSKSDAEKRVAIAALGAGVSELAAAVVAGEVPADRADDPLLGHVLFHVFPPAVPVTRERYVALWRARADHREHPAILGGPEGRPPEKRELRLPRGGYRVREGATVDAAPFEPLRAAVVAVHADPGEENVEKLGNDLFAAWTDGTLATAGAKGGFLQRVYRRFHEVGNPLSESPDGASEMLRYREFLADAAREIVQEAFRAARAANPERYERLARAKLSPRPYVGPGLVRSVWRTVESRRAGEVADATARERLARQLRSYELEGGAADRLLACADRAAVQALLGELPRKGAEEVELGDEHLRALQDLAGAELAAIQRELFGDGSCAGKLEYAQDAERDGLALELEVTKRRAHVPIGFCEGVCTAVDEELWNEPRFLQVIFWGEDDSPGATPGARRRRARGGMHLLVVSREGTTPALALPGINPSLSLLGEAGADALLDKLLGYAVELAKHAGFGAVWIPTRSGIASNRGPILDALARKAFPAQAIPNAVFSRGPYAYSFDRVHVVWESVASPTGFEPVLQP